MFLSLSLFRFLVFYFQSTYFFLSLFHSLFFFSIVFIFHRLFLSFFRPFFPLCLLLYFLSCFTYTLSFFFLNLLSASSLLFSFPRLPLPLGAHVPTESSLINPLHFSHPSLKVTRPFLLGNNPTNMSFFFYPPYLPSPVTPRPLLLISLIRFNSSSFPDATYSEYYSIPRCLLFRRHVFSFLYFLLNP